MSPALDPVVVTLAIDDAAQRRFDDQRAALFPTGRTQVGAHVTLFHALPGSNETAVLRDARAAARRPRFAVAVTGLVMLGRGVAYRLESEALLALHGELRRHWSRWLTRQDSQPLRPHVTVQNKVTTAEARATAERLGAGFSAYDVEATGLQLWRYRGGPWEPLLELPFDPDPPPRGVSGPGSPSTC